MNICELLEWACTSCGTTDLSVYKREGCGGTYIESSEARPIKRVLKALAPPNYVYQVSLTNSNSGLIKSREPSMSHLIISAASSLILSTSNRRSDGKLLMLCSRDKLNPTIEIL